jgi:hypothetical protein
LTAGSAFLYQAYVGRVRLEANANLDVMMDDFSVQTGTPNTRIGNSARTWYEGISYAPVSVTSVGVHDRPMPKTLGREKVLPRHDLRGRHIAP